MASQLKRLAALDAQKFHLTVLGSTILVKRQKENLHVGLLTVLSLSKAQGMIGCGFIVCLATKPAGPPEGRSHVCSCIVCDIARTTPVKELGHLARSNKFLFPLF